MKKCKKNFKTRNVVKGYSVDETETIFLYNIVNDNGKVIYIGITNDIKQTKARHFHICDLYNAKMIIIGSFFDINLAEFIEIQLIQEYLKNGVNLLNKVVEFSID